MQQLLGPKSIHKKTSLKNESFSLEVLRNPDQAERKQIWIRIQLCICYSRTWEKLISIFFAHILAHFYKTWSSNCFCEIKPEEKKRKKRRKKKKYRQSRDTSPFTKMAKILICKNCIAYLTWSRANFLSADTSTFLTISFLIEDNIL